MLLFGITLCSALTFGQVGIGTATPDDSSVLQLDSTNKGFLMTKISLQSVTDTNTIPNPAIGLLVWNTGKGGLATSGFYFWNNNQWTPLSTSNSNGGNAVGSWSSTGNNAGNDAGDKTSLSIGTSTYDDLVFKVNNNTAGRLGAIGTSNIAFGNRSLASGFQSIAIGTAASTTSNDEVALGNNAKTASQSSVAIGSRANAMGQYSVAIGHNANTSQQYAIVLGDQYANIGIGTSTPNKGVKIDVAGSYKLGSSGSVQKNLISFETAPPMGFENIPVNKVNYVDINIPNGSQLPSTKATISVSVSPDSNDFNSNFAVVSSRLISASKARVYFMNISNAPASLYYVNLYVTMNEF